MIEITSKTPKLTSQYAVCPIPYRLDTYTGCTYGCKYCFARDIIQHVRKIGKQEITSFSHLTGMNTESFKKWISNTLNNKGTTADRIAFRERIPVKIGGVADPFPIIERTEKITYEVLKILDEIDYPVQVTTKNPAILAEYVDDFLQNDHKPNWAVSVTIITADEGFRKAIEENAPSIDSRFEAIKQLTSKGIPVLVKIQPVFYPYIMSQLDELAKRVFESGAYAIQMEGLKVRVSMDKNEQAVYKEMSDYVGYDIREWYKANGIKTSSDYELRTSDKMKYIDKTKELCSHYGLKFFAGDNDCRCHGCSGECCGTEILRNYKTIHQSEMLLNTPVKIGRSKNYKTISSVIENNKIN